MSTPFKMKGWSGWMNSPAKSDKHQLGGKQLGAKEKLEHRSKQISKMDLDEAQKSLQDSMTFDEAFAKAKSEGKKTFNWQGGSYGTKTKEEELKETTVEKIPTIGVQPLETTKQGESRPDPTYAGTDEFRSIDEIRDDSRK